MKYPFEATLEEIQADAGAYVASVFSCLESDFMELPKGQGFIEYPTFEHGYEELKKATNSFTNIGVDATLPVVQETPMSLIVIRTMLGFTPPEWAYLATQRTGVNVTQGAVRSLDRKIRLAPEDTLNPTGLTQDRIRALLETAGQLLADGCPETNSQTLHRLDKADTKSGLSGVQSLSQMGVPYAMLLYERFLGRPFAGHRDSISELIGDKMELLIEHTLDEAGVGFRKTKRAEKIDGFDQAPDFIVPDEFSPKVVMEAKITEDDGTARDKVTRIQHLASLSRQREAAGKPGFEVVACIGGRGFGVRRSDMEKLLIDTKGKVFTQKTMPYLVEHTRLAEFKTK